MIKIFPIELGVLAKPIEQPQKTDSGVYSISANNKSMGMRIAEIVSIGDKVEGLEVGMKIFHYANVGTEMTVDGIKYIFLEYRDVKGYLNDTEID